MNSRFLVGLVLIALGIGAILKINLWSLFWPLLLIFAGIRLMSRNSDMSQWTDKSESKQNKLDETIIFSGIEKKINSNDFKGGKVTCIFGGGTLDLVSSEMKLEKVELEVTTIFGGLKLIMPKNWRVETEVVAIAGGYDNKTDRNETQKNTLTIKGTSVFGGLDILN